MSKGHLLVLGILLLVGGFIPGIFPAPSIDSNVLEALRERPLTNIIITMRETTSSKLAELRLNTLFTSRAERLSSIGKGLQDFSAASQAQLLRLLHERQSQKPFNLTSLWITNQIAIRGADSDLVRSLKDREDISRIENEFFIEIDAPLDFQIVSGGSKEDDDDDDEVQWGVRKIEAPKVWESGNKGEGIVIATIDTGVRASHEALRENFLGDYGWYDPFFRETTPYDSIGHGTHVTANIAGRARKVGVAPGVRWMSCKGCDKMICSAIDLYVCGQWVACPRLPDGTEDCTKAPHIVSNSWGGDGGNNWYDSVIEYYHTVGIIPVFSMGNSGPTCGSARSPGDAEHVIGVGSTTIENVLSEFSSVGPTKVGGRIKPDVAAPGSNIVSAYHASDTAYASYSGTSMACPHVAGVIALMLAEDPSLSFPQVKAGLELGSVSTLTTGSDCGGVSEDVYPNHHVGHGRINAVNSVRVVRAAMSLKKLRNGSV